LKTLVDPSSSWPKLPKSRIFFFVEFLEIPLFFGLGLLLFLTFWQSDLSFNSEARGGPIYLKFLPNNLALISIHF
jgi:hypothetical protein